MPEVVKKDGGVIHYDAQGPTDGPAIVLIEGLSAHLLGWRDGFCQPFIDSGFRVIRFDNRDVGLSQHYHGKSYRLRDMAEDVHELIQGLEIAPVHVVGQSMGGMIAQHLVIGHPDDVDSLTLVYTTASAGNIAGGAENLEALASLPRADTREEAIEIHIERERLCASTSFSFDEAWKRELGGLMWDRSYDPEGIVRQADALVRDPIDVRELAKVTVPTLIIHGTGDQLISHTGSAELHQAIPRSDLWLIDGMGHDLPRELWPDLTSRIIAHASPAAETRKQVGSAVSIERVAGAPISWGVSEVPGWGHQLERDEVLDEMRALGLTATEFGPAGFLPDDPMAKREYLHTKGLRAVGGFLPVVLHHRGHDPMPEVEAFLNDCLATGATVMVLAAATGVDGYDEKPTLTDEQWMMLYDNVNRISGRSAEVGITSAVHPHMGTVIENASEVERVLAHSDALLCIDTGHLVAAGADPVALTTANPDRVGHVHLKDVDPTLAAEVQAGTKSFSQAVAEGLFCPLGSGAVDVAAMIAVLESVGYDGWYVLEQDLKLESGTSAASPARDVRESLHYVLDALADNSEVTI